MGDYELCYNIANVQGTASIGQLNIQIFLLITCKVNYLKLLPFCSTCQGLGIDQHGISQGIDVYSWAAFCNKSFKIFSKIAHGSANSKYMEINFNDIRTTRTIQELEK